MKPHAYLILLLVLMDSSQASYTQLYTHPTLQQKRGAWCIVCESEFNSKSASKACCFNDEKHVDVRAFQDFCSKNGFPETRGSRKDFLQFIQRADTLQQVSVMSACHYPSYTLVKC